MHDDDWEHEHYTEVDYTEQALSSGDLVQLVTVGIDVGSSTSHLMFSRLHLERQGQALSSRYVVVLREVLHRSPILLTPYTADYNIDAEKLGDFVHQAYREAGMLPGDVDSGAIILTGEAVKRDNAQAIAHRLADESGRFVCATAGANLESVLAAHGSGAVALSYRQHKTVLNVDVGGGTTKLALIYDGEILNTAAINVGGRLVAIDEEGRVVRIEPAARQVAEAAGVELTLGEVAPPAALQAIANKLAEVLFEVIDLAASGAHDHDHGHDHGNGHSHGHEHGLSALSQSLMITPNLHAHHALDALTFSGGVSEYIYSRETRQFGDLAPMIAIAVRASRDAGRLPAPVQSAGERIRATVIGASQFTVQVSGNTIDVSKPELLPLRNLKVIYPRLPKREAIKPEEMARAIKRAHERLDIVPGSEPVALAVNWNGTPRYALLRDLAAGIAEGMEASLAAGHPLVLVFNNDFGNLVGGILRHDLNLTGDVISIDGIELSEFDFIDIGEVLKAAQAVPVVVKSLVFPAVVGQPGEVLA
jgi:ethanolamine utilization protein EutA